MTTPHAAMLDLPGARLHYEVRGTGPLLLVIPGGPQDAGVFDDIAAPLSAHNTVVAFDPRGNSRSPADDMTSDLSVDRHADDAAALIGAMRLGPARLFGTSGGAQIGLNLAARHPTLVHALVAHEPPTIMLLDDPAEQLAADRLIQDTYRREGVDAAMGLFFSMNALGPADGETAANDAPPGFGDMPPEAAATFARVSGNFEYWLAHGMIPLATYVPDIAALRAGKPRIAVAIGEGSAGQPIAQMGEALARQLGTAPLRFPGDHMGFEPPNAEAFAAALRDALA